MAQPTFETLLFSVEGGIATVTLNRPDRLNAFTTGMMVDLIAAFDVTDADDAVKAVIVTGAGRGFCAGADLSAGAATFDRNARREPGGRGRQRPPAAAVPLDAADPGRLPLGLPPGVSVEGGRVTLRIFDSLK